MNIENKKFLDTILRNASLYIFFVDNNCKIQYANESFAKLMGYTNTDEILGKEPEEILGINPSYIRKVIDSGVAIEFKPRKALIDKNGNAMYFSISCIPITEDKTGKIIGAYEILQDITELQKKEELANQIIENMPYPVHLVFFGPDRKIQYADKDYTRLVGYKRIDKIKGKNLREILSITDEKKLMIDKVFETKNPIINKEMKIKDFDNKTIYVLCSCIPINAFGNLFGVLEVLSDITELKNKENLIQGIIKNIPYPTKILFVDNNYKIQYANDEFAKLRGYANAREIIGKEPEEILGVKSSYIREVINTGKPIINKKREPLINKDNALLYHIISIIPIQNESAEVIGALEILHDVTKLIEQQMITDQILRNIPYPIHLAFFNSDRKIQYADKDYTQLLGYKTIDGIIGKSLQEILSITDEKRLIVEKVFETKNPIINKEKKITSFDNKTVHVLCSCIPINDAFGNLFGVLEVLSDITELKNTQNNLIMKNKELEDYAHTVSHDLRTPLITIQGFINMLEEGIEQNNKEDIAESLKYIKKSISKMDELLSDTLKLSSIDYDKSSFELLSFNNIVTNTIEQLCTQIETRGIKLIKAQDFPVIFVNKLKITEMLTNLIENSIKYIGEDNQNPVIEIGYKEDENNTVFFVKDNGIGIDPSQHEKIFNIFYKVDTNTEGTGVGLAIVKKIINTHNGKVWVESELGKGTTIFFTLPMK